ncbi:MAG TPA: HNH endonuclease [Caulobacteraceae bacterium]|nr:HNH endonuclease [Caulobacteraceae bacterium]
MKGVFLTKVEPAYDDLPEQRYHFPRTYLRQAEATVGDWIVYYEPRRMEASGSKSGGRQAYFAAAKVIGIRRDPGRDDHFYADVADFIEFDRAVPFREAGRYYEAALQREDGGTSKGAFGRAVRNMPVREFDAILTAGFAPLVGLQEHVGQAPAAGFDEEPATFERPMVERLTVRPFRDAAFAASVKRAYSDTCALTGLKIVNGGGRTEAQAAHIRPVADDGPDSVRNGLALSATIHWMFDRGLVSVDDDLAILVAADRLPDAATRLLLPDRRMIAPSRPEWRPHAQFLRYHRDRVFKG